MTTHRSNSTERVLERGTDETFAGSAAVRDLFDAEEVRDVLRDSFFRSEPAPEPTRRKASTKPKPDHYDVICISMYKEDLERLDEKVAALKAKGHRKMNRSALIRFALDTADTSKLPRNY